LLLDKLEKTHLSKTIIELLRSRKRAMEFPVGIEKLHPIKNKLVAN
jgi:hypothetical protein